MPSNCVITFNENPSGVYYSGQTLSGKVNLTTDQIKGVKGVHITITGTSFVCWLESTGFVSYRSMKLFFAHEEYLKSRIDIMRSDDGKPFDFEAGNYVYSFQFNLPDELPSSFNSKHGKIYYEAVCTIERSKKLDIEFKHPFTVITPLDLNMHPTYMHPVSREISQSFNKMFCFGDGGMITIKGSTPHGGYVPGQRISVSFHITNQTQIGVYDTNASLVQMVEYRSYSPHKQSKYEPRIVETKSLGKLDKGEEKNFYSSLYIPAVAPSSLSSSKIIEVSYYVEIHLKTYEFHSDVNVRLPIIIGTIPRGYRQQEIQKQAIPVTPETNNNQALPTYEEAVLLGPNFIDSRNDHNVQEADYIPRYPVYNTVNTTTFRQNDLPAVIITQPMETNERY